MSTPAPGETTFRLGTFDLSADGRVKQGGSWKTAPDNRIVVVPSQGAPQTFEAQWKFDADNHLVLAVAGTSVFDFNTEKTKTPRFECRNSVLRVSPNVLDPFSFELRGEWGLTKTHDLEFTPLNGELSTISGFINSPDGKFIFFFSDKKRPLLKHKLGFVGTWETSKETEGHIVFNFKREDGTTDTFQLPSQVTISKTTNQLRYEYKKGGVQAIDFEGTLIISDDFTVNYHVSKRFSQSGEVMVGETTLSFGAVLQNKNFTGNLELALKRQDGSVSKSTLSITGQFAGVLGKTVVAAGFTFEQSREGQKITTTFGFAGRVQFSGGTIVFAFTTGNASQQSIALSVGADIKLGKVSIDARLNITDPGGKQQGITFLLGTKF